MLFFCQAEDGIRDLVRSRGLGDVYKRQTYRFGARGRNIGWRLDYFLLSYELRPRLLDAFIPVSYTHLTLPTRDLV